MILKSDSNKKIDYSKMYWFSEAFQRGALRVIPQNPIENDYDIMKGRKLPIEPLVFQYDTGAKQSDLIATGYPGLFLVSDYLLDLLKSNSISGWSTYPVQLRGKSGDLIQGYNGFAITGRCGELDYSRCKSAVLPSPVGIMRQVWVGIYFGNDYWDGCNFFAPEETSFIFVTENVKNIFDKAKLKNVQFERLSEFEHLVIPNIK